MGRPFRIRSSPPGAAAGMEVCLSGSPQALLILVRAKPTAFGSATLEGSADAARFFRIVTRPALSPPWRTRPLEPTRWRHRNPSGRRATGIDGRTDLVRPYGPSFGHR